MEKEKKEGRETRDEKTEKIDICFRTISFLGLRGVSASRGFVWREWKSRE